MEAEIRGIAGLCLGSPQNLLTGPLHTWAEICAKPMLEDISRHSDNSDFLWLKQLPAATTAYHARWSPMMLDQFLPSFRAESSAQDCRKTCVNCQAVQSNKSLHILLGRWPGSWVRGSWESLCKFLLLNLYNCDLNDCSM